MVAPLRRVLVRRPATRGRLGGRGLADARPGHAGAPARGVRRAARRARRRGRGGRGARRAGRRGLHARPADPERPRRHPAAHAQARPAQEPGHAAEELERLGIPVLGTIEGDAYADGGDRFWLDDATMARRPRLPHQPRGRAARCRSCWSPRACTSRPTTCRTTRARTTSCTCSRSCRAASEDLYVVFEPLAPVRLLAGPPRARHRAGSPSTRRATSRWAATCSPSGPASW